MTATRCSPWSSHWRFKRGPFGGGRSLDSNDFSPARRQTLKNASGGSVVEEGQRLRVIQELGEPPESLKWANLSELDALVNTLFPSRPRGHGRRRTGSRAPD